MKTYRAINLPTDIAVAKTNNKIKYIKKFHMKKEKWQKQIRLRQFFFRKTQIIVAKINQVHIQCRYIRVHIGDVPCEAATTTVKLNIKYEKTSA